MLERRRQLGGFVPERRTKSKALVLPGDKVYDGIKRGSGKQEVATTMAFVRLVRDLAKDPEIGPRIVPIIPDEARTFGMDSMFPTQKIYNPNGQAYTSVDAELMLAYKESEQGQILHEGINEAGSTASFTAVGTSYATQGEPMIPIYIFYSMFGFQRTGDGLWAAADQMARGFVLGATAGRTTLTGEGLQHADGHSLLLAHTNPAVVAYDPAWSFEVAHIVKDGLRRMYGENAENVFYYMTVYNEPYVQPAEPEDLDVEGLLRGLYQYQDGPATGGPRAQILGSGVGLPWALKAQQLLADEWGVSRRRVVRHVVLGTAPRRRGDRPPQPAAPGRRAARAVRDAGAAGRPGPGRRRVRLDVGDPGPDPPVRADRHDHPGHGRLRLLRHPPGRPPPLPGGRGVGRRRHAGRTGQARRGRARTRSSRPRASTASTTCRPPARPRRTRAWRNS